MTNTNKTNLNTVMLRGIADKLQRMSPDDINNEGLQELEEVKKNLDDLLEKAERILWVMSTK